MVYIGVGSNIDPTHNIPLALDALMRELEVMQSSTFYWSKAVARENQEPFLNGVWSLKTLREARELKFDLLRKIEADLGRQRSADKHAARTIDLDLLLYHEQVIDEENLTVPDPEIGARSFLSIPLGELAPELLPLSSGPSLPELEPDTPFTQIIRAAIAAQQSTPPS
ncbi:MAG: 2-amino-4-hydroxy-6-hydroxymethyldihydropteridine diphosphokinase [Planctomycetota bacterium]|jgi:2-amino-4-hydroxy-6-hydroxymethyldihydropteridine diphosphokinase